MPSRRLHKLGRLLAFAWLLLGLTLGVFLGLELLLRLGFAAKDAIRPLPVPDPRVWADGYGGEPWVPAFFREQEALDARRAPYVEFTMAPHRGEFITVGDDGTRRVWAPPGAPSREVWLVGGSAAWGWGARDDHDLASEIAKALDRRGLAVRVRNLAQIGHVSTQEALGLLLRLRSERPPDLVVSYGGVNDLLVLAQGGTPGDPQNEPNRAAEFNLTAHPGRLAGAFVKGAVSRSAFARLASSTALRLGIKPPAPAPAGPSPATRLPEALAAYEANLRLMGELAERHGFRVLACWQPDVFTKRTLVPYEREKAAQHPAIAALFPDAHRALDRHAFRLPPRVTFRNLARIFDDASNLIYVDFCHTTEAANVPIAEAIAADVAAALDAPEE
jgi:lysophospholipase L1-like esterase